MDFLFQNEQLKRAGTYVLQCCLQSREGTVLVRLCFIEQVSVSSAFLLLQGDAAVRSFNGQQSDLISSLLTGSHSAASLGNSRRLQPGNADDVREVFQSRRNQSPSAIPMFGTLAAHSYDRAEPDISFSVHPSSNGHDPVASNLRLVSSNKSTPTWQRGPTRRIVGRHSKLPFFATPLHLPNLSAVPSPSPRPVRRLSVTPIRPFRRGNNLRMTPTAKTSTPKLGSRPPLRDPGLPSQLGSLFTSPSSRLLSMEDSPPSPDSDPDLCPACTPQTDGPLVDSRNFVRILCSCRHTCRDHSQMIEDHIEMAKQLRDEHATSSRSPCLREASHGISIFDFPLDLTANAREVCQLQLFVCTP